MIELISSLQNGGGITVLLVYIIVELKHLQRNTVRDLAEHELHYHNIERRAHYEKT
jgi:hypothetical protein